MPQHVLHPPREFEITFTRIGQLSIGYGFQSVTVLVTRVPSAGGPSDTMTEPSHSLRYELAECCSSLGMDVWLAATRSADDCYRIEIGISSSEGKAIYSASNVGDITLQLNEYVRESITGDLGDWWQSVLVTTVGCSNSQSTLDELVVSIEPEVLTSEAMRPGRRYTYSYPTSAIERISAPRGTRYSYVFRAGDDS